MTHSTSENEISEGFHFVSAIYNINAPQFLDAATQVANTAITDTERQQKQKDLYPAAMSAHLGEDERLKGLSEFLLGYATKILAAQGYNMASVVPVINEFWLQEHFIYSSMDQHVHDRGAQINAFFVIDNAENGCKFCIHDPRPGKVQAGLEQADFNTVTYASNQVFFELKPGTCVLTNSWLPHSFTRNGSNKPTRFFHINIGVKPVETSKAIVI